ncbi:MAG TPA: cysteine synthase family protein [Candidatus Bathyarchaeia archaeon]|nr:cysteine synthase family protein [Candidatus Bathyarchaeia archaeon]
MGIEWTRAGMMAEGIFETIGRTPLAKLRNIPRSENVKANILVKLEYMNPTGSLKDRIYHEMITKAVERGDLKPGMEILEASTGNAGIACSFVGTTLGYKVTVVMPAGMSQERQKIIRAYGAQVITTPGGESDVDLCLKKIEELKQSCPGKYWEPGQFGNADNVAAHYKTTGPEIWEQSCGKVDCFLASQGTGGTLTGVGRFLKSKNSKVALFAVEPFEAPILAHRKWGTHKIEGIGDGFVPRNLELSQLTGIITTTSDESILMAKRLAREEGIFCGISSGCNVVAALKAAKKHPEYETVVTMVNDTGQRYFSTELCGEKKHVEVPDREHVLDDYTVRELNKYQTRWEIIE